MKTVRIAGTPLELDYHNETGNGMRDGLKSVEIGKSAAKSGWFFQVATTITDVFTNEFVALAVSPSSAGSNVFLEIEAQLGLISFPMKIGKNLSDQICRDAVTPNAEINGPTGFDGLNLDVSFSGLGNELNRAIIAHRQFYGSPVLKSDWTSCRLETVDAKASLAIKKASNVSLGDFIHNSLPLTFNDYPEMEYAQVGGSTRLPSQLYMKEGEIVFSSSKDEAGKPHQVAGTAVTTQSENKPYVGDDYMAIAWPSTYRTVKNSLETLHQYTAAGIQLIFNAEIGRYENVRFTEQTNCSKGITSTGSSGTAWSTAKSDWCFFFGEDTVVEGIAIPEEIRAKIPTDYGRSKGVAYYSINGFGLVHNQTDATESRIVMWDSAA